MPDKIIDDEYDGERVYYCPHCCEFFVGEKLGAKHRDDHNHRVKEVRDAELRDRVIANQG